MGVLLGWVVISCMNCDRCACLDMRLCMLMLVKMPYFVLLKFWVSDDGS